MVVKEGRQKVLAAVGTSAVANAMRQINPDVVAAYPITPQTAIVEEFSGYVANGSVDTEYITVESEHSAMSACIGASTAGARVMTATSSCGLALMWEVLYVASSLRCPIVMCNVNRALSGPINIHCDHSDSMGARDSSWIQFYSEDAQEAYDNTIQAVRIAENIGVRLPVMVMMDGFIISHAIGRYEILEDEVVQAFVGDFPKVNPLLDPEHPITAGPFDSLYGFYFEFKKAQENAMSMARKVILDVGNEYAELSGRHYSFFEPYRMDDAELAIVVLGSTAGTSKIVIDGLRNAGVRAGLIKLRTFRPFPYEELGEILSSLKAVGVLDRSDSFGAQGGPVFAETRSALYDYGVRPHMLSFIYGLGGRDVTPRQIEEAFGELMRVADGQKHPEQKIYLGLKGGK